VVRNATLAGGVATIRASLPFFVVAFVVVAFFVVVFFRVVVPAELDVAPSTMRRGRFRRRIPLFLCLSKLLSLA
jgi:hypothetical protein